MFLSIVPPNRESQAEYEHPLQRQLDNPAEIYSMYIQFGNGGAKG